MDHHYEAYSFGFRRSSWSERRTTKFRFSMCTIMHQCCSCNGVLSNTFPVLCVSSSVAKNSEIHFHFSRTCLKGSRIYVSMIVFWTHRLLEAWFYNLCIVYCLDNKKSLLSFIIYQRPMTVIRLTQIISIIS